jgi:hypothetical protein
MCGACLPPSSPSGLSLPPLEEPQCCEPCYQSLSLVVRLLCAQAIEGRALAKREAATAKRAEVVANPAAGKAAAAVAEAAKAAERVLKAEDALSIAKAEQVEVRARTDWYSTFLQHKGEAAAAAKTANAEKHLAWAKKV